MYICILGRQSAIGIAELEALYGANTVRAVGNTAALVDVDELDFKRLGGSSKAGLVYETLPGVNPQKAFSWLQKNATRLAGTVDGKLKLGVSIYDLPMDVRKLNANTLSLKKAFKQVGQSVRIVPNTEPALSSAQTYHNNLTDERGCEILLVRNGNTTIIARATNVQGIDAYRKRDQERPRRDSFVGMLPPKLAQTIINLGAGETREGVVLDPFCGTGVLLQEASLMGYDLYGTDLEERMTRYTRENLDWLFERYPVKPTVTLETADATDHIWRKPVDIVAAEGYLGHPFSTEPSKEALMETVGTCNVIMRKFLKNTAAQLEPGTRLCIAAPCWLVRNQTYHLPCLDDLENLGYNRIDFVHANRADLIYRRKDQVVGRELVVLTKE